MRKENGYTQEEIGNVLGLKRNAYSQAENCGNFDTLKIKKLAEFFKVDVRYLLYGEIPKVKIRNHKQLQFSFTEKELNIIKKLRLLNKNQTDIIINLINNMHYKNN